MWAPLKNHHHQNKIHNRLPPIFPAFFVDFINYSNEFLHRTQKNGKKMEALNLNLDCALSRFSSKPCSKPFFSCRSLRLSCRKSENLRVRSRRCSEERRGGGSESENEDLVKRVGRGAIGLAAAVSLCCGSPSPAAAESLTVAFPVSHTREVIDFEFLEFWFFNFVFVSGVF